MSSKQMSTHELNVMRMLGKTSHLSSFQHYTKGKYESEERDEHEDENDRDNYFVNVNKFGDDSDDDTNNENLTTLMDCKSEEEYIKDMMTLEKYIMLMNTGFFDLDLLLDEVDNDDDEEEKQALVQIKTEEKDRRMNLRSPLIDKWLQYELSGSNHKQVAQIKESLLKIDRSWVLKNIKDDECGDDSDDNDCDEEEQEHQDSAKIIVDDVENGQNECDIEEEEDEEDEDNDEDYVEEDEDEEEEDYEEDYDDDDNECIEEDVE